MNFRGILVSLELHLPDDLDDEYIYDKSDYLVHLHKDQQRDKVGFVIEPKTYQQTVRIDHKREEVEKDAQVDSGNSKHLVGVAVVPVADLMGTDGLDLLDCETISEESVKENNPFMFPIAIEKGVRMPRTL